MDTEADWKYTLIYHGATKPIWNSTVDMKNIVQIYY